jgi:hypothetical protein
MNRSFIFYTDESAMARWTVLEDELHHLLASPTQSSIFHPPFLPVLLEAVVSVFCRFVLCMHA